MAEHYLWRLLSVKVQAVRTLGISESHCKQVLIYLHQKCKRKSPPLLRLLARHVAAASHYLLAQAGAASPDLIAKSHHLCRSDNSNKTSLPKSPFTNACRDSKRRL